MNKKNTISFALSQEELFVILSYLKVPFLLGLDGSVLEELSDKEQKMVMGVAERALFARGFLIPGNNSHLKLTDIPLAIVGACTKPATSLILNINVNEKSSIMHFFHTARKMVVYHSVPVTAIHQFIALENKQAMAQSTLSLLDLGTPPALDCPAGELTDEIIAKVRDAIEQNNIEEAKALLNGTDLDPETSKEFMNTLEKPAYNHTVVHFKHDPDGEDTENGFSLLAGENGLWMLQPIREVSPEVNLVTLTPSSIDDVAEKLKEYILSEG